MIIAFYIIHYVYRHKPVKRYAPFLALALFSVVLLKKRPAITMRHFLAILILVFIPLHLSGADECFDCHDKYNKTNHGKLDCTACHSDAKDLPHPEKLKKPDCASCHDAAVKMYGASAHDEKKLGCKQCHTVHNLAQGSKKCISCHPSVAHKSLPSARKHLAAADCTGCHSRSVHGEINVRINTRHPVLRETIDKDGNNRLDEKEWKDFLGFCPIGC